ncbi:abortive infection family protein [Streptosporangium sp. NPDC020072]|uniref:abortive infection family protein n=1 Tax=Streptosporangium sp. NPDC020072 TaxID=3154788 RepID=UPI0034236F2E
MDLQLPRPAGLDASTWSSIESYRTRLEGALAAQDHALVIGTAKELVEATARVVLDARGQTAPSSADFPSVVNGAHAILDRQPGKGLAKDLPIRNVAQGARTIVLQLAEIRNQYGTGHGRQVQPEIAEEMIFVSIEAALLWTRWSLRRLGHLIDGEPAVLVRDLRDGGVFRSGELTRRLQAANLSALQPAEQHLLGVAVGQRAMNETYVVRTDGVEACATSSDLDSWPADYRAGLVEGMFLDREGYVRADKWGGHYAGLVLAGHPDAVKVLKDLSGKLDHAAWSYRFTTQDDLRKVSVTAMNGVTGLLADEEAQRLWVEIANRFTANPGSRLEMTTVWWGSPAAPISPTE